MAKKKWHYSEDLFFTVEETAFLLRRTLSSVYTAIKKGAIKATCSPDPTLRWQILVSGSEIGRLLNDRS